VPKVLVDELRAIVESIPRRPKGKAWRNSLSAPCTAAWLLPSTAAVSTQVVWMSVRLGEWTNSPSTQAPALRNQIDLREARLRDIPAIGLEWDVVLEQRPRFRPPVQPLGERVPIGRQPAIHLRALMVSTWRSTFGRNCKRQRAHGSHSGTDHG
jgi:hypothetical protein